MKSHLKITLRQETLLNCTQTLHSWPQLDHQSARTLCWKTLKSKEVATVLNKGQAKYDGELEAVMQAHIGAHVNAGWRLHSFTSLSADFIKIMSVYTTRHFFMWERAEQAS